MLQCRDDQISRVFHLINFNAILRPASYEPEKDIERLTVLKSVHIFKKHRVQYEMRTHYRCIEVRIQSWDLKPAESDDLTHSVGLLVFQYLPECVVS